MCLRFLFFAKHTTCFCQSLIGRECCERGGGEGATLFLFVSFRGDNKESKHATGVPSSGLNESILFLEIVHFFNFCGMNKKQRSCDSQGGAQRPVWRVNETKTTGVRSARARTRGQNPLVQ